MRDLTKTLTALAVVGGSLLAAGSSQGAQNGVAFAHGTSDYLGTQSCSGTGSAFKCVVSAAVADYWGQIEIDAVRNGRAYVVTGHHGGSWKPWTNAAPVKGSGTEPSTGDEIAAQLERFLRGPDGKACFTPGGTLDYSTTMCAGASGSPVTCGGSYTTTCSNANVDNITDLVVVTHSGASNQLRFILQQAAGSANRARVKAATRKVIAVAAPSKGTYLSNQVFTNGSLFNNINGVVQFFGGSGFFNDDGTHFIRTNDMATTNADAAKFVNLNGVQGGVTFRQTGGSSTTFCAGVTLWGTCVGATLPTLGSSTCDSLTSHLGLQTLHALYLNANDSATARDKCSDGFISCASAKALGSGSSTYQWGFSTNQDHNQSRRTCNNMATKIRDEINGTIGNDDVPLSAEVVAPKQWDTCGFTEYASQSGVGYQQGCFASDLGDGYCDPDCLATYGHDAAPTWKGSNAACSSDATCAVGEKCVAGKCLAGSGADCSGAYKRCFGAGETCVQHAGSTYRCISGVVKSWATNDDCGNATYGPTATTCTTNANCSAGYVCDTNAGRCMLNQSNFLLDPRPYNGKTQNGSSTVWFTDPYAGTPYAASYCPASWIGDGYCDECVLALYGSDGNDCLPGRIASCTGIKSKYAPYSTTYNTQCNAFNPADGCSSPTEWNVLQAYCTTNADCPVGATCISGACSSNVGNGRCDLGECKAAFGTLCSTNADCTGAAHESWATCVAGRCNDASSKCTTTADCTAGTCSNGACTTAPQDCNYTTSAGVATSLCL